MIAWVINKEKSVLKKSTITILIATHVIAFSIGAAITKHNFLANVIPDILKLSVADPRYIQLSENGDLIDYDVILSKYNLGHLYFYHHLYKSKRAEGEKILSELAEQGYTPAAWALFNQYIHKSHDYWALTYEGKFIMVDEKAYDKALYWARLAAKQGFVGLLAQMFRFDDLAKHRDVTEDIKLMEELAPKSAIPDYAMEVSTYYTKQNMPEKADHWRKVAEEIEAKPFKRADNEVITPWRGQ